MQVTNVAVILNYSTSVWGASKTDREISDEVLQSKGASRKAGKFTKHLLGGTCHELEAIRNHVHEFRTWIQNAAFPSQGLGRATVIVPHNKLLEICQVCRRYQNEFYSLVEVFVSRYEDIVSEAKESLAQLAADDYPTKSQLLRKFNFDFYVMPIPKGAEFDKKLGLDELEQALADQYESKLEQTYREGEEQLASMLQKKLTQIYNSLTAYVGEGRGSGAILSKRVFDAALDEVKHIKSLNFRNKQDINRWCTEAIRIFGRRANEYRSNLLARQQAKREIESVLVSMGVDIPITPDEEPEVVTETMSEFNYADLFPR